jgi:hypothetical protein
MKRARLRADRCHLPPLKVMRETRPVLTGDENISAEPRLHCRLCRPQAQRLARAHRVELSATKPPRFPGGEQGEGTGLG